MPSLLQHLIIFLVLIKIPSCLSSNDDYMNCANFITCGSINISFPFWGENRPKECGHPLMELSCKNAISYITIKGVTYRVLDANPDSHTLTITRVDFLLDLCQPNYVSTNLDYELYVHESLYKNLTLFYGCTFPSSFHATNISCNNERGENVYSQFGSLPPRPPMSCHASVVVPVPPSLTENNIDFIKVHAAIRDGFVVRWIVGIEDCGNCERLGGVCGIDWSSLQTTCYCKNGTCSNFSPDVKASPGTSKLVEN
ncbi:unnamed protein product [Sphenostylis stenocarpa]|uniref:non-specific serine/threonine protein kinase n=1 Tax=Sphenostylis stenocarpa TaxID=92480 RepID=A0AA86V630_9FABA|nr:unnamed protein product [Sphenostylis stenocarpa]